MPIPTPIHLVTSYQIVLVNLPAHEAEPGHRNILAMWPGGRGRDDHANDRLRRRAGAPEHSDLAEQNSSYGLCQVYADICVCAGIVAPWVTVNCFQMSLLLRLFWVVDPVDAEPPDPQQSASPGLYQLCSTSRPRENSVPNSFSHQNSRHTHKDGHHIHQYHPSSTGWKNKHRRSPSKKLLVSDGFRPDVEEPSGQEEAQEAASS